MCLKLASTWKLFSLWTFLLTINTNPRRFSSNNNCDLTLSEVLQPRSRYYMLFYKLLRSMTAVEANSSETGYLNAFWFAQPVPNCAPITICRCEGCSLYVFIVSYTSVIQYVFVNACWHRKKFVTFLCRLVPRRTPWPWRHSCPNTKGHFLICPHLVKTDSKLRPVRTGFYNVRNGT